MSTDAAAAADACPVNTGRDDRKSAKFLDLKPFDGSKMSRTFAFSREILRSADMKQGGGDAEHLVMDNPDHVSFFFLDGDAHRRRRASVAGYFTPKAIVTRYHPLMKRTMDEIVAELQSKGSGVLDELSFKLAAYVTLEVLGLTTGSDKDIRIARRMRTILNSNKSYDRRPIPRFIREVLLGWFYKSLHAWRALEFYKKDITPAAELRRKEPREDVISYMVKENYSMKSMIMECMTYGGAGVATTREFMVMASWQLFDHPDLKERFLNGTEEDQFAILEEILRLDPIAGFLYRRVTKDIPETTGGPLKEGDLLAINLRASNSDEAVTGACPHQLDPDRAKKMKVVGPYLSFGDGPHRCPGAQVALHETRIFLDRLLRVPGIRLVKPPQVGWNWSTQGYELRGAIVACDPA
jgi:cytochrome P450